MSPQDIQYWCSWCGDELPERRFDRVSNELTCSRRCTNALRKDDRAKVRDALKTKRRSGALTWLVTRRDA